MARRNIAFVLMAGWLILGLDPLPKSGLHGSAYAQEASKKFKGLEGYVEAAKVIVEAGEPVSEWIKYCGLAWHTISGIKSRYPNDTNAVDAVARALEACNFEIPVAYFFKHLDAMPCDTFFTEAQDVFGGVRYWALGWAFGDGTPEQQEQYEAILSRFKAALSERVTKACPAQAEAQGY